MNWYKKGIVVQGPLISSGKTGLLNPYNQKRTDCRSLIDKHIDEWSDYFDYIVIATWEDQPAYEPLYENVVVLYLKDPYKIETRKRSNDLDKIENKKRQFYSTFSGIQCLSDYGFAPCDLVVKIRTDQQLDVVKLCKCLEKLDALEYWKIHIPFVSISSADRAQRSKIHFRDYYFAGPFQLVSNFAQVQLVEEDHSASIHQDALLRYAYFLFSDKVYNHKSFFISADRCISVIHAQIIKLLHTQCLRPLPRAIYKNMIWRGDHIKSVSNTCVFSDTIGDLSYDAYIRHLCPPTSRVKRFVLFCKYFDIKKYEKKLKKVNVFEKLGISLVKYLLLVFTRFIHFNGRRL